MAATESVPSTDRSILPIRMTKVSPIASVSGTAAELATRIRLRSSMKLGLAIAISMHNAISTASGARLRQCLPPKYRPDGPQGVS